MNTNLITDTITSILAHLKAHNIIVTLSRPRGCGAVPLRMGFMMALQCTAPAPAHARTGAPAGTAAEDELRSTQNSQPSDTGQNRDTQTMERRHKTQITETPCSDPPHRKHSHEPVTGAHRQTKRGTTPSAHSGVLEYHSGTPPHTRRTGEVRV